MKPSPVFFVFRYKFFDTASQFFGSLCVLYVRYPLLYFALHTYYYYICAIQNVKCLIRRSCRRRVSLF